MAVWPFQFINPTGIPTIKTIGVSVTDTSVDFIFHADRERNFFRGLLLVNIADSIPDGTTATLPIRFSQGGVAKVVTVAGGDDLTVAGVAGPGVYLVYYDRYANTLQLL